MEEELEQFTRNDVWELLARPDGVNIVGTKWIFKNKTDEHGEVVPNKARLVDKVTHKLKELILRRPLPQLRDWNLYDCSWGWLAY